MELFLYNFSDSSIYNKDISENFKIVFMKKYIQYQ